MMKTNNSILKEAAKRGFALLLVLFMLFGFVPEIHIDTDADGKLDVELVQNPLLLTAEAVSVSTSVTNLGAADLNGKFSGSGTSISGSVTGKDATSGCNSTPASSATDTLTLTNNYTTAATLSFNYSVTLNSGTVTIDGSSKTSAGAFSKELAAGGQVQVVITSATGAKTTSVSLTNLALEQKIVTATTTFTPSTNGSFTVDGTAVTSNITRTQASTQAYNLSATPDTGYVFAGWKDVTNNTIISGSNPASICVDADKTITAVFNPADAARFQVGSSYFTDLNAADAYASSSGNHKIILVTNGEAQNTLYPGNYTISNGNTLLIPFDSSNTMYTTSPNVVYNTYATPTAYRVLTILNGATITVKNGGAISVSSKLSSKGQMGGTNGCPTGDGGRIDMRTGSNITLESGGKLYCWGYIYGGGMVEAKSGATVYEAFQLKDWRGGTATSNCYSYVFPFNQYYVQNIECPLKINAGASESLYGAVNASSSAYTLQAAFIGSSSSSAMFRISSGYIIKDYLENTDQLSVQVHGNVALSTLTVSGLPMVGSVDTSDYDLPITNNIKIDVQTGTVSMGQDVKLQPGSEIYIERDAKFQVSNGKKLKVYDLSDWGNFSGSAKMYAVGYSVANGTTAVRTTANMSDVTIDVNGVLEVAGQLYTSAAGANITSTLGTSGNNGKIVFGTAPSTSNTTVYEMADNSTKTAVTFSAPQLHNGNGTYSQTVSTGTGTWYYDKDGEHWYRYMVDFNYNGSRVGRDYYCENNDTITYDASYLTNLAASVTSGTATVNVSGTNVTVTNVTADSVVTLTGQAAKFIPTFVLNEHQAQNYETFTGTALTETRTIDGKTFYVVKIAGEALDLGTSFAAPTDAEMGVTAANYNAITWNLSGVSATSGNNYGGTVPVGPTSEGEVYIYGFYTGSVAYNSVTDTYYSTLAGAMADIPQDGLCTVQLVNDCGSFEEENGAWAFPNPAHTTLTLDLNGHHALGRIINNGTMTLELNGGTLDFHTGATAAAATYKGLAAVINSGTMTIQDSVGGGKITSDAISNAAGTDGSAVIRNNAGATLSVTGKDADHLLPLEHKQNVNANNYGIFNLGTITALTNVDISTKNSGTTGLNVYNYNTGVITLISGGHMFCASNCSIFNYGGTITTIDGLTIDGKNGIVNRNIVSGALASGYSVTDANKGVIGTISNSHIEVGQYAINNHAVINTLSNSTFIAHPDSAQVDTRGNGSTASEGNVQCYTIVNNNDWWYNTNVWKQVDSSSGGYTRVNYYKEDEQYRPIIGTITNCEIYAEVTSTSSAHGYALTNYGVINTIGGTTNIKAYKHPDNAKSIVGYYAMHNLSGGIIKSIEGTVNISATGIGTMYNDGQFTTQNNYTYANKVGGNITYQKNTYGQPSTINSITCSGTWSCGGSNSYYYALMNSGYIGTINSTGLTLKGGYNVLYNATGSANKTYEINRYYTDGATSSTEYKKVQTYVKNLEKGSTIGSINGITVTGKGSNSYYPFNNQGHIGTVSNVTVNFAEGATANTSYYVAFLNGDSRYASYTETIQTNRTAETDPHLTVSAGIVTKYDRSYVYDTPTIDVIDNLTVNSITLYAFRNAGHIGTLKNSTITGTQYALHNSDSGPYTERQSEQYYSGTSIFTTTKGSSDLANHYKKNASTIDLIDNCTITTPANTYAMLNGGHVGTIKNSTFQSGTTTAKAYALANTSSTIREYTRDLSDIVYITANGGTSCTTYYGSGGESDVVIYDYDAPVIDLIGEGNTFKATAPTITNTGIITEINSGDGTLSTVTSTAAKYYAIYNYSANLDARTTTTPYTAATAASTSGTKGTAVNDDTLQPGAQIGTIKNVYINANGYGILNGDASAGKTPTIGEIGEGTEIYAHCTTAGYHAIYNQANAKVTSITGGVYTVTKATTNAYKNNNTDPNLATLISGGDFKGMSATRANAIFEPDNTSRQIYQTGKNLSSTSHSVNFNNGTTVASGTGYYYLVDIPATVKVVWADGTTEDTNFWSIQDAVEAAVNAGDTVVLLADATGSYTIPEDRTIALDLNGHTINYHTGATAASATYNGAAAITNNGTLTIQDTSASGNGKITTDAIADGSSDGAAGYSATILNKSGATLTITGGTIEMSPSTGSKCAAIINLSGGTIEEISGGTISAVRGNAIYNVGTITSISGGTFDARFSTVYNLPGGTISTISGGVYKSGITWTTGYSAIFNSGHIGEISGGEFTSNHRGATTPDYEKYTTLANRPGGTVGVISGGVFTNENSSGFAIGNDDTSAISITGGHFKGGTTGRLNAIPDADNTAKYNYPSGKKLSSGTESVTVNGTNTDGYYYIAEICTVTFNVQGHGTAPADQSIESGQKVTEPTAPTAEGWVFEGWYKEAGCDTAWNFSTDTVTADTELFAKWSRSGFTVTFNVQGHGTAPNPITNVAPDSTISAPTAPTASGYRFDGWYKEADCTTAWDFSTDTVTADTELFAKWTAVYTVTFNMLGHGTAPSVIENIESGSKITAPESPAVNGLVAENGEKYRFLGWYKEADCTIAWDFAVDTITANTELFAKWAKVYTLTFVYNTGSSDKQTTINYTYGQPLKEPTIRYYKLTRWEINGESYTTEEVANQLYSMIEGGTPANQITVKAYYERLTYNMKVYVSVDGTLNQVTQFQLDDCYVGRTIWISAPATFSNGAGSYPFKRWEIGVAVRDGDGDVTGFDPNYSAFFTESTDLKTSFFYSGEENITEFVAIAYFDNSSSGGNTNDGTTPHVTVRDYYAEEFNDTYRAVMTLEVIAPANANGYSVKKVGFGYTTNKQNADERRFSENVSANWGSDWTSGTYVVRFALPTKDTNLYSYGYLMYALNGTNYKICYADGEQTASVSYSDDNGAFNIKPPEGKYDTTTRNGKQ